MVRLNKEHLSVDTVHTPFGLTKLSLVKPLSSSNEPKPRTLTKDLEGHVALSPPTHEGV